MKTQENNTQETVVTVNSEAINLYEAIRKDKLSKQGRYSIDCVKLEANRAVVTNGHFMIIKNIQNVCEGSFRPLKKVKSALNTFCHAVGRIYSSVTGEQIERVDEKFPDYEIVIPKKTPNMRIALNADYLLRIAEGLGTKEITLEIIDDSSPVKVLTKKDSESFGVIMPVIL